MKLSNTTYDILKWIATLLLPALGTLYFALASIWGFPYGEQIVGTITAVDTFLGVILGISTRSYKKTDVGERLHERVLAYTAGTLSLIFSKSFLFQIQKFPG